MWDVRKSMTILATLSLPFEVQVKLLGKWIWIIGRFTGYGRIHLSIVSIRDLLILIITTALAEAPLNFKVRRHTRVTYAICTHAP